MNHKSLTGRRAVAGAAAALGLALSMTAAPALAQTPTATAVARTFSCTGTISRNYTKQTVTGTLTGLKPTNVTVLSYLDAVMITTAAPGRTNGWWGGYWKTTYQLNQWNVGKDSGGTLYHLMLPDTRMGATFDALLVSEFGGGAQGNWQNWMSCSAG